MVGIMKNNFLKSWFILILLSFVFVVPAFASCEECDVSKSCEAYQECMAAKLRCLAACKEKEAAEISARSSEKTIEVQEKIIETLREVFNIAQRTAELLEKLNSQVNENK